MAGEKIKNNSNYTGFPLWKKVVLAVAGGIFALYGAGCTGNKQETQEPTPTVQQLSAADIESIVQNQLATPPAWAENLVSEPELYDALHPTPTPESTQPPLPSIEVDMIIAGWKLVRFPDQYSTLIEKINERTGLDWLARDCSESDCHTIADIERVIIYDSLNLVQIDLCEKRSSGSCSEFVENAYQILLSEEGVDYVIMNGTGGFHEEIVYIGESRLGAVLESHGHDYEGLADLLIQANPQLTRDQIIQLLQENYIFTMQPNRYCGDNTDNPMVAIIPPEDSGLTPQMIRTSEELYPVILDYVLGNTTGDSQ